jgi:hypothetical protein
MCYSSATKSSLYDHDRSLLSAFNVLTNDVLYATGYICALANGHDEESEVS